MFSRFIFRLMGLEQKPPEPFQGDVGGVPYYVETRPKGYVAVCIDMPRERMLIQPMRFEREQDFGRPTRWQIQALFTMGASSVDVGKAGDKIEVVVPAFLKKVDKESAEQMVPLMTYLRNEALGEQTPYQPQRPWSKEAESSLDLDGQTVAFEFSSCFVDTNYEDGTAGNLEVMVRTNPPISAAELSEKLRLALPGFDDLVESDAHVQCDDGTVEVSFGLANSAFGFDAMVREAINSIQDVDIFWGERRERMLATVPCERS